MGALTGKVSSRQEAFASSRRSRLFVPTDPGSALCLTAEAEFSEEELDLLSVAE